jgi:hypothetical protein
MPNFIQMIKNQVITLLFIGGAFLSGCNNDNKELETKLNEEVMAVHNDVMPKMGESNRIKRQLKSFKEVVPDENAALKDSLINTILLLSKSEDMMSDWMTHYKYPNAAMNHDEIIKYLEGQKDSIKMVSDNMYKSIAIANGFLKQVPDSLKTDNKK